MVRYLAVMMAARLAILSADMTAVRLALNKVVLKVPEMASET